MQLQACSPSLSLAEAVLSNATRHLHRPPRSSHKGFSIIAFSRARRALSSSASAGCAPTLFFQQVVQVRSVPQGEQAEAPPKANVSRPWNTSDLYWCSPHILFFRGTHESDTQSVAMHARTPRWTFFSMRIRCSVNADPSEDMDTPSMLTHRTCHGTAGQETQSLVSSVSVLTRPLPVSSEMRTNEGPHPQKKRVVHKQSGRNHWEWMPPPNQEHRRERSTQLPRSRLT